MRSLIATMTVLSLGGCMTMDQIPTSQTYDVFKAACMSGPVTQEIRQAAMQELTRRGHTCSTVAQQVLQIRAANPQVFAPMQPVQQQPYFMPTRPPSADNRREAPPSTMGIVGTLHAQTDTYSVSGQRAFVCTYASTNGMVNVTRIATDGPCPPTVNLR